MLVLRRNVNERIVIGDDITIQVLEISDYWVRLGIDAPIEVPVHREEIYEAIRKEQDGDSD